MKNLVIIFCLFILALPGWAQPDAGSYYAASRLDYYTGEEVGEVLLNIPETKKDRKISIDLVFEYEALNKGFVVSSTGVSTVPFPLKRLRVGNNEITVSFYEDDKWVDSRKIWITIRPSKENAVMVDRAKGGIFANGILMLPSGFFACQIDDLDGLGLEAANGFNLVTPYQNNNKKTFKRS